MAYTMDSAPRDGCKLYLWRDNSEFAVIGYFDRTLGWVAEHKNGYPESGIAQVQPTSWMPA